MRDLETIDLNLLVLLDWLLKEQSVTRAAERVGVTQSAASRSLQKLRQIFGDELLVRSGRTYTLSRLASELQPGLSAAIAQLRVVTRAEETFDPKRSSETFTIASNDYLASLGMQAWQNSVASTAPNLRSNWRPLETQVIDLLASGRVDIVLAPYAAKRHMPKLAAMQDMVLRPLLTDRFVLFASAQHALIKAKTIDLSEYANARHVLVSPQGRGGGMIDQILTQHDLHRDITHRTWSFGQAAGIALMTGSVVVLPEQFADLFSAGRTRPLPFEIDALPSFIAWHASRTSDPAHRWVRTRLMDHFKH